MKAGTGGAMLRAPIRLCPSLFDARQNVRNHFRLGLGADVAFAVQTDGNISGVHVAAADDEHRVDFRLLRFLNLAVDFVRRKIRVAADEIRAQFVHDGLGVVDQRFVVVARSSGFSGAS